MDVLLGIGGTEDSLIALERTVARTAATADELTIAIFANPDSPLSTEELERRVDDTLTEHGVDARVTHVMGEPGPALTDLAENREFDRLVLGGGQRSPMGKITIGPIAEFVVVNADISVTLIR